MDAIIAITNKTNFLEELRRISQDDGCLVRQPELKYKSIHCMGENE